jgi:uncharacterized membrane protein
VTTGSRRTAIIILSICLLLSVCLNLFAAGAFVATRWALHPLATVMRTYPPSLRHDVRERLRAEPGKVRAAIVDLHDARERMFAVMRADPLDKEALQRAMADVRVKTTALQALLQSALADSLEQAPLSERQKIKPPGLGLWKGL